MFKIFYVAATLVFGIILPITTLSILPTKFGLSVAVIFEIVAAYFILDESIRKG